MNFALLRRRKSRPPAGAARRADMISGTPIQPTNNMCIVCTSMFFPRFHRLFFLDRFHIHIPLDLIPLVFARFVHFGVNLTLKCSLPLFLSSSLLHSSSFWSTTSIQKFALLLYQLHAKSIKHYRKYF